MKTINTTLKIVTAIELEQKFGDNYNEAIRSAMESYMNYIVRPGKPILSRDANSSEATVYAKNLEVYETSMDEYRAKLKEGTDHNRQVNSVIEEYLKEISGFNSTVPADKKDKVWSKAYSEAHSGGYNDVYVELVELVELFA